MDDKKVNIEGLNMSMNEFLSQFEPGEIAEKSPAQKINIEMDNKLFVVGFNLMCEDDIKYDLSDLNNDTIVVINQRSMLECLIMIAGAINFTYAYNKSIIMPNKLIRYIHRIKDRMGSIIFFSEIHYIADSVGCDIQSSIKNCNENVINKLKELIQNIWFLPYSEIDKLKEKIRKELGGKNE